MGHFDKLKDYKLKKLGREAELYMYTDPNACAIKQGMVLEYICHRFLEARHLLRKVSTVNLSPTLDDILKQFEAWGIFEDSDFQKMCETVRLNRNSAVHYNFKDDQQSTIKTIPALAEFCMYMQNYDGSIVAETEEEYNGQYNWSDSQYSSLIREEEPDYGGETNNIDTELEVFREFHLSKDSLDLLNT